jgi:hypothetical protein
MSQDVVKLMCQIAQVPLYMLNILKGVKIRLVSFPTQCPVFIICFFLSIQCYIDINVSVSLQILLFLCHAKKNIGRHLHLISRTWNKYKKQVLYKNKTNSLNIIEQNLSYCM